MERCSEAATRLSDYTSLMVHSCRSPKGESEEHGVLRACKLLPVTRRHKAHRKIFAIKLLAKQRTNSEPPRGAKPPSTHGCLRRQKGKKEKDREGAARSAQAHFAILQFALVFKRPPTHITH